MSEWIHSVLSKLGRLGIYPAGEATNADADDEHWRNLRDCYIFYLNPTAVADEVAAFERRFGIRLPEDYRSFVTEVGNGGFGPGEGLEPLGKRGGKEYLHEPLGEFPLRQSLFCDSDWILSPGDRPGHDHLREGTVILADYGCGISARLVVCGECYGEVWIDDLANDCGIMPAGHHWSAAEDYGGTPKEPTFADWYDGWLDRQLIRWRRDS